MSTRRKFLAVCGSLPITGCNGVIQEDIPTVLADDEGQPHIDGHWWQPRRDPANTASKSDSDGLQAPPTRYWKRSFDPEKHWIRSTPAVTGDIAFLTDQESLLRLDANTGDLSRITSLSSDVSVTPVVTDDDIYLPEANGILSYDQTSGERGSLPALSGIGAPTFADTNIYAGIDSGSPQGFAVDVQANEVSWSNKVGLHPTAPCTFEDIVVFGDRDGQVSAFHLSGDHLWSVTTPDDYVAGSIVADGNGIYVSTGSQRNESGHVVSYTDEGRERWRIEFERSITGDPALADGSLYIADYDGRLYAIDAETGDQLWVSAEGDIEPSRGLDHDPSPSVIGETVLYPDHRERLSAFDVNGEPLWRASEIRVKWAIAVEDAVLYGNHGDIALVA